MMDKDILPDREAAPNPLTIPLKQTDQPNKFTLYPRQPTHKTQNSTLKTDTKESDTSPSFLCKFKVFLCHLSFTSLGPVEFISSKVLLSVKHH